MHRLDVTTSPWHSDTWESRPASALEERGSGSLAVVGLGRGTAGGGLCQSAAGGGHALAATETGGLVQAPGRAPPLRQGVIGQKGQLLGAVGVHVHHSPVRCDNEPEASDVPGGGAPNATDFDYGCGLT